MKSLTKFFGITAIGAVIMVMFVSIMAGCATTVPIKSVKMPTINGMDTVKSLGIQDFQNKSGVSSPPAPQIAQYMTDTAKEGIQATGKFTIVAATDPNADGVFFGELRSIKVADSSKPGSSTDKNGNTVTWTDYYRNVSVEFVYGVKSTRTGVELGTVRKQGSAQDSARDDPGGLSSVESMARGIVSNQMKTLVQDLVPTIVSTNEKLMEETLKDKAVKQLMKTAKTLVKNGNYNEAIEQYDQIAKEHNSVAAKTNAATLRRAIESDAAASAKMSQLDSERAGLAERAVKGAVDSLTSKLPAGSVVMVMKLNATEARLLDDLLERITAAIVQDGKLNIVDRSNQALIQAEQKFQLSGDVDDNSAVSIGKQLGAKYAVLCSITGVSSSRRLILKVLNIETSRIDDQSNFEI
ncbi:MAG: penicillin-binding protein activator LpoB [Treponema sp.]|nr:penicillin-binding protein activator LpoB [Treponema sp.]